MALERERRLHLAVGAVLVVSGVAAFAIPIQASESGVLPAQGCSCHGEQPSAEVQVRLDGWPAIYSPGDAYPLTVTGEGPVPGSEGGLSVDVTKGSLSSADPLVAANGNHATHTGPDERSWPLLWTAPPEDSGNVRFTVYVNLVNGDGSDGPEDLWNLLIVTAVEKAPEPPKPSTMVMAFAGPDEAGIAGENFTVSATLKNASGAPIRGATVAFTAHLTFGTLPLALSKTDENGTAYANWSVPAPGLFLLMGSYDGSSKNLSSNATIHVNVYDPNGFWEEVYGSQEQGVWNWFDPVRVPLLLVVGGVWATFGHATVNVLRVRKSGAPQEDGPIALLKLIISRRNNTRRKKP